MLGPEFSIYLPPHRAVYIDIAKVASSSLKLDLQAVGGNPHALEFPRPPESIHDGKRLYPGLYTFAFVRNPWDRMVSCYRDKIRHEAGGFTSFSSSGVAHCLATFDEFTAGMSFESFVHAVASIPDADADEHFRSQHPYLTDDLGGVAIDFVGRYENLQDDFRHVAETIGLPSQTVLPRLQVAASSVNYTDYYTQETQRVVASRFCEDIERFAYQFKN